MIELFRTILQRLITAFQESRKSRPTTSSVAIGKPAEATAFSDLADVFVEHSLVSGNFFSTTASELE